MSQTRPRHGYVGIRQGADSSGPLDLAAPDLWSLAAGRAPQALSGSQRWCLDDGNPDSVALYFGTTFQRRVPRNIPTGWTPAPAWHGCPHPLMRPLPAGIVRRPSDGSLQRWPHDRFGTVGPWGYNTFQCPVAVGDPINFTRTMLSRRVSFISLNTWTVDLSLTNFTTSGVATDPYGDPGGTLAISPLPLPSGVYTNGYAASHPWEIANTLPSVGDGAYYPFDAKRMGSTWLPGPYVGNVRYTTLHYSGSGKMEFLGGFSFRLFDETWITTPVVTDVPIPIPAGNGSDMLPEPYWLPIYDTNGAYQGVAPGGYVPELLGLPIP